MKTNEITLRPHHEVADFLIQKYAIRYNTLKRLAEVSIDNMHCDLVDHIYNQVFLDVKDEGFKISEADFQKVTASNRVPLFDPIEEFFKTLPKWDGQDHIIELANSVSLEQTSDTLGTDIQEIWQLALRKWLIGVYSAYIRNDPAHFVLVLTGGQGIGKTTWLRNLCPKELQRDFYFEGHVTPKGSDRDTNDMLTEKLVINLDDQLDLLSRRDLGNLKTLISSKRITSRKAHARNHLIRPRIASLVGSTNEPEFLMEKQNRRFLVFDISTIDWERKNDLKQVYAQAIEACKAGETPHFTTDQIVAINKYNQRFIRHSVEYELVEAYFQVPQENQNSSSYTATDILHFLQLQTGNKRLSKNAVGRALSDLGFEQRTVRVGDKTPKKWRVIQIKGARMEVI